MTTIYAVDVHWSQRGLCRDDPQLFDGFTADDRQNAGRICRRCPVLAQCDERRLTQTELTGVIAGVSYGK